MSLRRAHFLLFDEDRVWGLLTTPADVLPLDVTTLQLDHRVDTLRMDHQLDTLGIDHQLDTLGIDHQLDTLGIDHQLDTLRLRG